MRIPLPWCAALLLLLAPCAHAQIPEERELWVPTDKLAEVLKRYPRAVLLSRAEYESLLHDTSQPLACNPEGFPGAVITSAEYEGKVNGETVQVTGKLTVQMITDDWVKVPLRFQGVALGAVEVSGRGGLVLTGPEGKPECTLLLRGRGEQTVTVQFSASDAPPATDGVDEGSGHGLALLLPVSGTTAFHLDLPGKVEASSNQPMRTEFIGDHTRLTAAPNQRKGPEIPGLENHPGWLSISWDLAGESLAPLPPVVQNDTQFTVEADALVIDTSLQIETSVGKIPRQMEITLPPGALASEVKGDEIERWEIIGQRLTVHFHSADLTEAKLELSLRQPWPQPALQGSAKLPVPMVAGIKVQHGSLSLVPGDGILLGEVTAEAGLVAQPLARAETGQPKPVAQWHYRNLSPSLQVRWAREQPHFSVDLDTLVDFRRDAIYLARTLTPHEKEGHVFNLALTVPAGEEVLAVDAPQQPQPEWRVEGNRVLVHWTQAGGDGAHAFTVQTRAEPAGWSATNGAEKPQLYTLTDAHAEGAEQVTGYIALHAADEFRLEAEASETLERRDGRITPVKGAYAWFRRDDYGLKVKVTRRAGERLATVTGYALPLAGGLEVHAQIAWDFRFAGARSVEVKVPKEVAERFNFEGAQIASRTLAGDTWTIAFQKEITGPYVLSVEGQFPLVHKDKEEGSDERQFTVQVPVIEPLHAQRVGGSWAVEANTDTEVEAAAPRMNSLDALLAPPVAGYQPRHRVIGVYAWLGPDYALTLTGTRHAGAAVLSEVVDLLELHSVATLSGSVRTQATLHLRTTGQQFLDVTLPTKSHLLSLLVDGAPIKPVGGKPGDVRVSLPEKSDTGAAIVIVLLFETEAGDAWTHGGRGVLPVPKLPADVPVLRTEWHAYLPEGFDLSHWSSNLQPLEAAQPRPLVLAPLSFFTSPSRILRRTSGSLDFDDWKSQPAMIRAMATPAAKVWKLEKEWDRPVRKFKGPAALELSPGEPNRIQSKLESLIIPKLELRDATAAESIDFLEAKSRSLDTAELDSAKRGVKFRWGVDDPSAQESRITVSLDNIPLGEALRYVTSLANLKYKVELDGVTIVPQGTPTDSLITKEWKVPPGFLSQAPTAGPESGAPRPSGGIDAKDYLTAAGITFPPGSSAIYLPSSGKLIIKNAQENLDLVDAIVESSIEPRAPFAGPTQVAGLLPMQIDLPVAGTTVKLAGLGAPDVVTFSYAETGARARHLWLLFLSGAAAFLVLGRRRPWWRAAWLTLCLSAIPLCLAPETTGTCNALLGGWLFALLVERLARRFVFNSRPLEVAP